MKSPSGNQAFFAAVAVLSVAILAILALLLKPTTYSAKPEPELAQSSQPPIQGMQRPTRSSVSEYKPSPTEQLLVTTMTNSEPAVQEKAPFTDLKAGQLPSPDTAIYAVIEANGGKLPNSGQELVLALQKLGDFLQLPVPFSAVALESGLRHPRVLITQRPKAFLPVGSTSSQSRTKSTVVHSILGSTSNDTASQPNLEGRLFLAANMVSTGSMNPRVKTVEFISWNSRRMKFDFGVIEGMGGSPEFKIIDGVRCFSCHKNRGPILGVSPWSNTVHNDVVRSTSQFLFDFEPKTLVDTRGVSKSDLICRSDGMMLLNPVAQGVDEGVRLGANLLRDREIFRALNRTANGRMVFFQLLNSIVEPGGLATIDKRIRPVINKSDLSGFFRDAVAIQRATISSRLIDFSPSGSMGRITATRTSWGGTENGLIAYDNLRANGNHGLTDVHLPSNTRAFFNPPVQMPNQVSDLISTSLLAHTIGLTEADRQFLTETLIDAAKKRNHTDVNPKILASYVFSGPYFADVLERDELPDNNEFKDRFVRGLNEVVLTHQFTGKFRLSRDSSLGVLQRLWSDRRIEQEVELVPTTSCLRCHDIQVPGKAPAFSPIPMLAFDPFDKTARETWVRTADPKRKVIVLNRMLKRLTIDEDMPPEDSTEYVLFRGKNPVSFERVKEFLETELKTATGGIGVDVPR
jgi:hypothetical protein